VSAEWLGQLYRDRASARGFLPDPLAPDELEGLFADAQRAPSWCNIQPWRVALTSPPATVAISEALLEAAQAGLPTPEVPFPAEYPEPYKGRRRSCGGALYGAMGVERGDRDGRWQAWLRNYQLFDAPHLAVVSRDRRLGEYATLDVGVWLGFLFTAAAARGIAMCAMASVAAYPAPLRRHLDIPDSEVILFGVALGRVDPAVAANRCRTEREQVGAAIRFVGSPT
jgi:nitroreductase